MSDIYHNSIQLKRQCGSNEIYGMRVLIYINGSFQITVGRFNHENDVYNAIRSNDAKNVINDIQGNYNSDSSIVCNELLDYIKYTFILSMRSFYLRDICHDTSSLVKLIEVFKYSALLNTLQNQEKLRSIISMKDSEIALLISTIENLASANNENIVIKAHEIELSSDTIKTSINQTIDSFTDEIYLKECFDGCRSVNCNELMKLILYRSGSFKIYEGSNHEREEIIASCDENNLLNRILDYGDYVPIDKSYLSDDCLNNIKDIIVSRDPVCKTRCAELTIYASIYFAIKTIETYKISIAKSVKECKEKPNEIQELRYMLSIKDKEITHLLGIISEDNENIHESLVYLNKNKKEVVPSIHNITSIDNNTSTHNEIYLTFIFKRHLYGRDYHMKIILHKNGSFQLYSNPAKPQSELWWKKLIEHNDEDHWISDVMYRYESPDQSTILSDEILDLIKCILIDKHPTIELHHNIYYAIQKIEAYKISHTTKNMKQRPIKSTVVQELRSMLSIKENEIFELNNMIANYNIKEKEIKMNELNQIISCNMNKMEELESKIMMKNKEIMLLNTTISSNERENKQLSKTILSREYQINQLSQTVDDLKSMISNKDAEIDKLFTTIHNQNLTNESKIVNITEKQSKLIELSQIIEELSTIIVSKDEVINKLSPTSHISLAINNPDLSKNEDTKVSSILTEKELCIEKLMNETIEELRSMIVSKDEVINKLSSTTAIVHSNLDLSDIKVGSFPDNETKLNELSRTIEELRTIITIKDEEINKLSSTIKKSSSSTNISTNSNIDNKVYNDVNIFTKILNHTEKETQIKQLSQTIEELRSMIASKNEENSKLSSIILNNNKDLNDVRIPSTTNAIESQIKQSDQTIEELRSIILSKDQVINSLSSTTTVVNNSKDLSNIRIPSSTNAIEPQINCDSQINEMQELRSMISMQDSKISQILTLISNNNESQVLNNTTSLKNNDCNDDIVENYQLNNKAIVHSQQQQQKVEILSEGKVKDMVSIEDL